MAAPIYFFPGLKVRDLVEADRYQPDVLAQHGAAPALAGVRSVREETSTCELPRGPGGASGVIAQRLPAGRDPKRIGYHPEAQAWHAQPAGSKVWVGLDRHEPPHPLDLARAGHSTDGYWMALGDGHEWLLPKLRSLTSEAAGIPRDFVYDAQGKLQYAVRAEHERLWELSGKAFDHYFAPHDAAERPQSLLLAEVVELCLGALALNYYVGPIEQTLLRLFGTANWDQAVQYLLDVPTLTQYATEKKTADSALPSASASPGSPASGQDTDPAGPSST